ncbi:type II toxin-antitoxin system RelE/ParE family toxin [Maricaulis alexandrii]|uniref:type II toxin-antitoxin system RelE/ParE family toxin n=1 Tax=Maricaulis alexandrii TaxID=2570354 RepID=UPI00110995C2|nr:type II toxin-antitoxin system RelE/ParE family toxin [Maricaulis alexandrii]
MTPDFRLTRRAHADLTEIARYTRQQWGETQCRRYLEGLDARFRWLCENPDSGRTRDDIATGSRSFRHNAHIIFYRTRAGGVDVLAIVHASMDTPNLQT